MKLEAEREHRCSTLGLQVTGQPGLLFVFVDCLAARRWPSGRTFAGKPDFVGGVKLYDPPILDNQGDRAVTHPVEKPRHFGHERFQIVASGRVQTCQGTPPVGLRLQFRGNRVVE